MKTICIAGYQKNCTNYVNALRYVGLCPLLSASINEFHVFPARNAIVQLSVLHDLSADALLLPGGGDIDPILFYEPNHGSHNIDSELDKKQLALLHGFVKAGKPVFGICKGMQIINIYFGGSMIQHLPTASAHEWCGHDQLHMTHTAGSNILSTLYGKHFMTNSAHHQGIGLPGDGLRIIQYSTDKIAEALIHDVLPIFAVQWHPERLCLNNQNPDAVDGIQLFHWFAKTAASHRLT